MGLTDQEARALAQIERHLNDDDPRFVARLARARSWLRIPRRVLLAVALCLTYAVGLVTLIAGVTSSSAPWSVVLIAIGSAITAAIPTVVGVRAWRRR
jgi:hypothetical protein